jgi:imidazoleglycerol-phosphate dehydratase/histidinol-phosphatase
MKNIFIDSKFFGLQLPLSQGLLSGLKKLSAMEFNIYTQLNENQNSEIINKILRLENIHLIDGKPDDEFILIAAGKTNKKNSISVVEKGSVKTFEEAVSDIIKKQRSSSITRKTNETDIKIKVELDGSGYSDIKTGIGFFDHMLEQIARHANINLYLAVKGDLHVDEHHTVEDTGIALGTAINEALGSKRGIKRYGFFLPMDDAAAQCAVDLGGRVYLNFKCKFKREFVGEFPTELTEEFFRGIASGMKANIYIRATGKNDHHKIEAIFKSFAKSLNEACRLDERSTGTLPSTKGII